MLTDERHNFIRKELASKGRVLAGDLAARFSVSEDTARRDLRELAKAGDCRRVYGGAVAPAPNAGSIRVRSDQLSDEKARLALAAVKLMRSGQSFFIDSGSTNIAIASAIPHDVELTVATNSLGVATALADHSLVKLIVLGGAFNRELGTCVGEETLRAISQLNADLLFLGSCGVDAVLGVTAFDSAEAEVKRAMAKNSTAIVVAATADKLATAAPFRVAGPEAIRHLVVDRVVQPALLSKFKQRGILIHRA
jgi:DeoR/GlpR family transcriptional regulator of sugar metabolism